MLRDTCRRIAGVKEHRISALSVMPDHVHIALRGRVDESPQEIALAYMNNLAHVAGCYQLWMPSYYAGTFGDYDMGGVWNHCSGQSDSPTPQGRRGLGGERER